MPHLIPNWRNALRMFSVQAQVCAAALLTGWGTLPAQWQDQFPLWAITTLTCLVLALGVIGRLIQQPSVETKPNDQL